MNDLNLTDMTTSELDGRLARLGFDRKELARKARPVLQKAKRFRTKLQKFDIIIEAIETEIKSRRDLLDARKSRG